MLKLSEPARADLKEITIYLAGKDVDAAQKFMREIGEKFDLLEQNPALGRQRDEVILNLRSFPVKKYVIFYFSIDDGVEIYRVLHGSRNIKDIFDQQFEGLSE